MTTPRLRLRVAVLLAALIVTAPAAGQLELYWCDWSAGGIERADLNGANRQLVVTDEYPLYPFLELVGGHVYWSQYDGGIARADLDGGNVVELVSTDARPTHVIVDGEGGHLYWAQGYDEIMRADLDGGNVTLIVDADGGVTSLDVDSEHGFLFWGVQRLGIYRSALDGSGAKPIVDSLAWWLAIAVDAGAGHVYWIEQEIGRATRRFRRANLDGSDVTDLALLRGGADDLALDVDRGYAYWMAGDAEVRRIRLDGQGEEIVTGSGGTQRSGIAVDPRAVAADDLAIAPGAADVPVGFPTRLAAIAQTAAAAERDVTGAAAWTSDNPAAATVSGMGEVRGVTPGSATIRATYQGHVAEAVVTVSPAPPPRITRASRTPEGAGGFNISWQPAISDDGRYVVFDSWAEDLVEGDANDEIDVFLFDRHTEDVTRVSAAPGGADGNGLSQYSAISPDGRFVTFRSRASNLVPGDENHDDDVFLYDVAEGTLEIVSLADNGDQGDGNSYYSRVSDGGRFVVFLSSAHNLVPGDDDDPWADLFLRDRLEGTTTLVNVSSDGEQGNAWSTLTAISPDGRFVLFHSAADNLVENDTNETVDVFLRDCRLGRTERVSLARDGAEARGFSGAAGMSADARFIAFGSSAANLVPGDANDESDAFIRDRRLGTTTRVSLDPAGGELDGSSRPLALTPDGRLLVFYSTAGGVVEGHPGGARQVYVRNLVTGENMLVSMNAAGMAGNNTSDQAAVSADGGVVAFASSAWNLAPFDANLVEDVLVAELPPLCPADVDGDREVGLDDLLAILSRWGPTENCPPFAPEDLDRNCAVDFDDLLRVLAAWGSCP